MAGAVPAAGATAGQGRLSPTAMAVVIAALLCLLLCLGAFALVRFGVDDSFADWFDFACTKPEYVDVTGAGLIYSYRVVDWDAARGYLQTALVSLVGAGSALAALLCFVCYRAGVRNTVEQTERIMDDLMEGPDVHVERYPRRFASIVARMGELKAEEQRRERQVQDETNRKNDLVTYIAHDLKTPLASVVGYLSLLCETPDMPADQRSKCLGITLSKAMQLENLIEEFFDIARYSLQTIELEKAPVDLDFMLVQLTDEFQPLFVQHGNTVEVSCEEGLTVDADAERLARVFNNILKNAVAYSRPNTPIGIEVVRNERTVCIRFSSRGDTIPRQKLDLIFEKFYRVDEARSAKTGGAGLGLAIAKEIVDLHGGTIVAKSEDGVTAFTVVLPA